MKIAIIIAVCVALLIVLKAEKKTISIFAVIVAFTLFFGAIQYFNQPDGSTLESREEICAEFPRGKDWKISVEQKLDDHIISGVYSRDGMSGVAIFEPQGNGKYKLQTREWRNQDEIVISGATFNGVWHDIIWFNGAKTDYAEITYTYGGKKQEPIIHNSKGMEIFINPAPSNDYTLDVIYYDSAGNKYE